MEGLQGQNCNIYLSFFFLLYWVSSTVLYPFSLGTYTDSKAFAHAYRQQFPDPGLRAFSLIDARAASGGLSCTRHSLYLWPFLGVLVSLFTVGPLELEAGKGKDRTAIPPTGAGPRVAALGRPPLVER